MRERKRINRNYAYGSLSFFLLFTSWAIWWGFFQIWLTSAAGGISLTGSEVGTFFSFHSIATVIVLFLYGAVQDRLDLRRHILIFVAIIATCTGPFATWILRPLLQQHLILGSIIGSVFLAFGFSAAMAIYEAYFGRFCVRVGIVFGKMRMWGSLGYSLALLSAGFFFTINPLLIFWAASCFGLALLVIQILLRPQLPALPNTLPSAALESGTAESANNAPPSLTMIAASRLVLANRKIWAVMCFALLTWSMYQIFESQMFPDFFTTHFADPARGQRIFGLFVGVQASLETLLMLLVPRVLAKYGAKRTVFAACMVMVGIVFSSAFASSIYVIMLTKAAHALMVPLLILGLMEYITQHFDLRLTATAYLVGYYVTAYAGNILLSKPFGLLRDAIGYQGVFFIFGISMLCGALVVRFAFENDPSMPRQRIYGASFAGKERK